MKAFGRIELICSKILACGVLDRFTIVVGTDEKDVVKRKYESMGYTVI